MKRNKIAAGALALALGLGAVAPSLADSTATPDSGKGQVVVTKDYRDAETKFVKAFKEVKDAEANLETAKANEAEAQAKLDAAKKALKEFNAYWGTDTSSSTGTWREKRNEAVAERATKFANYKTNGGEKDEADLYALTNDDVDAISAYVDNTETEQEQLAQAQAVKNIVAQNKVIARLDAERAEANVNNTRANLQAEVDRRQDDLNEAINKTQAAEKRLAKAESAYVVAKVDFIREGASKNVIDQAEKTGDVSYVTEAKEEKEEDKEESKDSLEVLRKAVEEAKIQKAASEYLLKNTPATVKPIESQLRALLAKQEELLEKAQKALESKKVSVADILFSTAYAAEEEDSEIDQLINDLNENTKAQQLSLIHI